jgi:hypothetical protein
MELSEIALITILSILITAFGFCLKTIFKSRCSEFYFCWGLLSIKRDTKAENDEENNKINNHIEDINIADELNKIIKK